MENVWTDLKKFFLSFLNGFGLNLARAAAILVVGMLVVRLIRTGVKKSAVKSRRLDNAASAFITSLVALIAYVALALLLIKALGFSTTELSRRFRPSRLRLRSACRIRFPA